MEYIPAKHIVLKTKNSRWFGTDYNMNIYRGCCHGCIYCDSRSDCYQIQEFDKVKAKQDALQIIRDDLRRKVKTGVVGTGAMSDPYNPYEEDLLLTRHALELVNAFGFGIAIATKSTLITRDIDILKDIKSHSPVIAKVTVTSADDGLSRKLEPHVAVSSKRFAAIGQLAEQGIFSGVLLMPVLPFIEDSEDNIIQIVRKSAASGARFIYPGFGVTLREGQRAYFYSQLDANFPGIKEKYQKKYGQSYHCSAPNTNKLWLLFKQECDKYGVLYDMKHIIRAYKQGYESQQLSFF